VRSRLAVTAALTAGLAIGWVDSRPRWDDTGVTAFALLAAAAATTAVARRRPWLIALAVGLPTPLLERSSGGAWAALVFAAVGAGIGWALSRSQVPVHGD
jgi:hypothetical protein